MKNKDRKSKIKSFLEKQKTIAKCFIKRYCKKTMLVKEEFKKIKK